MTPTNKFSINTTAKGKSSTSSSHPAPPTTPLNQKRKVSTPKTESPKRIPFQMVSKNMPESFSTTRVCMFSSTNHYIHLLWGLMEQKTVPGPPSQESIKEFHSRFSNADMIVSAAADEGAPKIIPVYEVVSLASLKAGRKKVGQVLVNIEEFHLAYLKATLACLGIRKWATDLENTEIFRRSRKLISRARDRVRENFAHCSILGRLPKQYLAVISDTSAHSDDEYNSKRGVYEIKTLPIQSENATKFVCRLDEAILKAGGLKGKRFQRRKPLPPKNPQDTIFPKPPKGLPLVDFYHPDWFNDLWPQQRLDFSDTRCGKKNRLSR
ncbi:hypothetical protein VP01_5474g1 [Puccinia sorghi]|uniref:Uncharacterized protein n=1 Tax=Puccinia sorghi TaxID=27349 RepID=A0A0L6UJI1_9BASI|nr:hypothetical protein VP01_5474g1 [Puccinia sorghi]